MPLNQCGTCCAPLPASSVLAEAACFKFPADGVYIIGREQVIVFLGGRVRQAGVCGFLRGGGLGGLDRCGFVCPD